MKRRRNGRRARGRRGVCVCGFFSSVRRCGNYWIARVGMPFPFIHDLYRSRRIGSDAPHSLLPLSGSLSLALSLHDTLFLPPPLSPPFLYTGYFFFQAFLQERGCSGDCNLHGGEIIGPYFKISLDAHISG